MLIVSSNPPDVKIRVDNRVVTAGQELQLSPGPHKVVAKDKCHAAHSKTVVLKRGERRREVLEPAVLPAGLIVRATDAKGNDLPKAEVWVDGKRAGFAFAAIRISACAREAEVRHGSRVSAKIKLKPRERQTVRLQVKLGAVEVRPVAKARGLDLKAWFKRPDVKLVAVTFYSTWSRPSMKAVPDWKEMHEKYRGRGLRLLAVRTLDPGRGKKKLAWNPDATISDNDGFIANTHGVGGKLPTSFLWNASGKQLVRSVEFDEIEEAVEAYFDP